MEGLSSKEVAKRLKVYGLNEIPKKKDFKIIRILFDQLKSYLVLILIIAGGVSFVIGHSKDAIAILIVVVINTVVGFIQEFKAEKAVESLKSMIKSKAVVIRDGIKKEIETKFLVPGDVLYLSEGDKIPADCKLLSVYNLKVDEAVLTGESNPVTKDINIEDLSRTFKGTLVVSGNAYAEVFATGKDTEFGKIVNLLNETQDDPSPLDIQIDKLSKKLGFIVLFLISLVFLLGYFKNFKIIDLFMTSVSLGVSAIPEGLPVILTLTLAFGVQALSRKKAIVRKLKSVETLGATTVICTDKTGTLTKNEMMVTNVFTFSNELDIPGEGYNFKNFKLKTSNNDLKSLLQICNACNNSQVVPNILGDPTEIALKVLSAKYDLPDQVKIVDEMAFSSSRKMMSVFDGKKVYTKGALEMLIKKCSHVLVNGKEVEIDANYKKIIKAKSKDYSNNALRVLGLAYKKSNSISEKDLVLVGLVAMIDPPRLSVKQSLIDVKKASIAVKVITGDNLETALSVARQIGFENPKGLTGDKIDKMKDYELKKALKEYDIFARTSPKHKFRLVSLLQSMGEVVAVSGDGVNDAPALKKADVGVAMGIKGTEATKEVADIVLQDDNFSTIVNAIFEGRKIYKNIISFLKFLLSANFDTIAAVSLLTLMGFPLPIIPLQVLFINLVTDAFPALALGQTVRDKSIMNEKPHATNESLLSKFGKFISIAVFLQIFANLAVYFYGLKIDQSIFGASFDMNSQSLARTMVFTQIVMFELMLVYVCKFDFVPKIKQMFDNFWLNVSVVFSFCIQLFAIYNPVMQEYLKTTPLNLTQWAMILLLASTAFLVQPLVAWTNKLQTKNS
ncbi:ATPase [bacterium]|mgnify:FL=1|nr:ATPase [bacterium]